MSTALSGPAMDLGQNMLHGVQAGLARANEAGGVNGRRLRLIALDDGYEPSRTAPNMRRLIEKKGVVAVIGNVGTPTAIAAMPIAVQRKTLLFAPFTGAGILRRRPPERYVINYRASYAEETAAMVDTLIDRGRLRPEEIAFFTQRDGYGDAGFAGGIAALKRHGLADENRIHHVRYERNTDAVENALAELLLVEPSPRAVIMVGAYQPCAKFIRLTEESGLDALFLNVSFVGSAPLALALGRTHARVVTTQVVPYPGDTDLPLVRDFHADMERIDPNGTDSFGALEGYIATRILLAALERIGGVPSREVLINALEGLGEFDLGLGTPLRLGPTEHQACHRVWPTVLRDGRFVPIDWATVARLVGRRR